MNKEYILPKPEFEKLFTATIELGDEYALGETGRGYSEITPVTGGTAAGIINGSILPFGGDWGLLHSETINMLDTKYIIRTDDDAYISVECTGILDMDYDTMVAVSEGRDMGPAEYYFRHSIRFTAGDEKYLWLNRIVAFGIAMITSDNNVYTEVCRLR